MVRSHIHTSAWVRKFSINFFVCKRCASIQQGLSELYIPYIHVRIDSYKAYRKLISYSTLSSGYVTVLEFNSQFFYFYFGTLRTSCIATTVLFVQSVELSSSTILYANINLNIILFLILLVFKILLNYVKSENNEKVMRSSLQKYIL